MYDYTKWRYLIVPPPLPQAIMQQLLAKQPAMESYQSLVSEVLLLPGDTSEKKKIEKVVLALYADWDAICHQVYFYEQPKYFWFFSSFYHILLLVFSRATFLE